MVAEKAYLPDAGFPRRGQVLSQCCGCSCAVLSPSSRITRSYSSFVSFTLLCLWFLLLPILFFGPVYQGLTSRAFLLGGPSSPCWVAGLVRALLSRFSASASLSLLSLCFFALLVSVLFTFCFCIFGHVYIIFWPFWGYFLAFLYFSTLLIIMRLPRTISLNVGRKLNDKPKNEIVSKVIRAFSGLSVRAIQIVFEAIRVTFTTDADFQKAKSNPGFICLICGAPLWVGVPHHYCTYF